MIYAITGLQLDMEDNTVLRTERLGYFLREDEAERTVKQNDGDINEAGFYPYVMIEEIPEGVYPRLEKRSLYLFNEETFSYVPVEEPEWLQFSL